MVRRRGARITISVFRSPGGVGTLSERGAGGSAGAGHRTGGGCGSGIGTVPHKELDLMPFRVRGRLPSEGKG